MPADPKPQPREKKPRKCKCGRTLSKNSITKDCPSCQLKKATAKRKSSSSKQKRNYGFSKQSGKKNDRQKAINYADLWHSRYTRLFYSDEHDMCNCATCGKYIPWSHPDGKTHNGHFVNRGRMIVRWDKRNTLVQCYNCNSNNEGEQVKMAKAIDLIHGEGTAQKLIDLGHMTKRWNELEIRAFGDHYKELAEAIAKKKGIKL